MFKKVEMILNVIHDVLYWNIKDNGIDIRIMTEEEGKLFEEYLIYKKLSDTGKMKVIKQLSDYSKDDTNYLIEDIPDEKIKIYHHGKRIQ